MTSSEFQKFVMESVNSVLENTSDDILKNIFNGTNDSDTHEQAYAKMFINSIGIASQISVQSTLLLLEHLGIIDPTKYRMLPDKPHLKLVWDSSKHQHEDNQ